MPIIAITGATGNMGRCLVPTVLEWSAREPEKKLEIRLLLRDTKKNHKFAKSLCKCHENVKAFFASITEKDKLHEFVKDADYCVHMAAIIPPRSDYNEEETFNINYLGTKNLVEAVNDTGGAEHCKFVHIGSVAEYGNRTPRHPFGRVGDPLIPSAYDMYAASKVKAERYVIESSLQYWLVLRQTGVLYDEILLNNMNDGLMFHTPLNCPIEWVTARDSAILLTGLIKATEDGSLDVCKFYKKIYNIGGGLGMRTTGYETLDAGFKLMGCGVQDVFLPSWIAKRNFHCMWFSDSYKLQEIVPFQNTKFDEFFACLHRKYWYFKLAKPFLAFVKLFVVYPLLKNKNSPAYWKGKDTKRYEVFCGRETSERSEEKALREKSLSQVKDEWQGVSLFCKRKGEDGKYVGYEFCKQLFCGKETALGKEVRKEQCCELQLDHGFDDAKDDSEIGIEDAKSAAVFRGGRLLSLEMKKGDMTGKLRWQCHKGHVFEASPCLIMRGGHWCPECTDAPPWTFGELAKDVPFYAQLYYDDHDASESEVYEWRALSEIG